MSGAGELPPQLRALAILPVTTARSPAFTQGSYSFGGAYQCLWPPGDLYVCTYTQQTYTQLKMMNSNLKHKTRQNSFPALRRDVHKKQTHLISSECRAFSVKLKLLRCSLEFESHVP